MRLFQLINRLRQYFWIRLFYWGLRLAMSVTFTISGLRKLPGVKFTTLPTSNPVGAYFQAMHDTGIYWNFIGFFQILLGLLLWFNRFAPLAILLMMPITINIFLVSLALNMRGTPVITALMVLGNIFLLLWHYENFRSILKKPEKPTTRLKQ